MNKFKKIMLTIQIISSLLKGAWEDIEAIWNEDELPRISDNLEKGD